MATRRCTAKARSGDRCRNRPIKGGTVCRMHGGGAPQVKKAAGRRAAEAEAVAVLDRMGIPIKTDPLEALLGQVAEAAGNVAFLRDRVGELEQTYTAWPDVEVEETPTDKGGRKIAVTTKTGLTGPNHLGDGAPHVWVVMYDKERDRLANMAKLCIEAGVAERQVALAERQGEMLAEILRRVFNDPALKLNSKQRKVVPQIVGRHLRAVPA